MNSEYTLAAGDRINADVPALYTQSMEVAQAILQPGDFIEIGIERKPTREGEIPVLIENVFARVEAIRWPFVDAVIHSKLRFTNHHGAQVGDTVSCSDKQIFCFLPAKYPKTKGWIEFVTEKVLEMQRAFLATLTLNELPLECVRSYAL